MSGTAQQLKLRLFLEGVEVPVIAANVQVAANSPCACSIQIPPLPEGTRLHPRTLVHLYFLDFYETQSPFVTKRGAMAPDPAAEHNPTVYEQGLKDAWEKGVDFDADNYNNFKYKLLFGGEVVGFQWTKSENNRSLVLQCMDWSNYWDYAYQWNNTDLFGPGVKAMFSGGSTGLFTDFLSDEGQEIIKIIQTPSVQYPNLKGLLGGIVHLIEAIGGSYYYEKQFSGENIFFSLAELRLHISQMIGAYEDDPTASRLLSADGYDGLFGRTLGGLGQQVSIRQAINALMGIIFHETYPIPTPYFTPGTNGTNSGKKRTRIAKDERHSHFAAVSQQIMNTIDDIMTDVVSDVEQTILPEDPGEAPTVLLKEELGKRFQTISQELKREVNLVRDKEVQPLRGFLSSALAAIARASGKFKSWQPNANPSLQAAITKQLMVAKESLARVLEFEITSNTGKNVIPARLNQQIFRPDVWFSAPPRCNVLFPDHYTSLNYQRMFLQEPTRFLLKTNDEFFGEDELFDQFYVTPRATTVKGGKTASLSTLMANDILDHELFTGILPVFEKMGELNIFAARSGTIDSKAPKIGLAQRSANFLYFKHRFAARQMSVSARFNPYIAPGFPGLIIDKYVDHDRLEERQRLIERLGVNSEEVARVLGTHFLGNFSEVTHNVDQSGGRTEISLGYPRQPEESSEFLGVLAKDQNVRKRFEKDAIRKSVVASLNPPKVGSIGPNYGQITRVTDVTRAHMGTDSNNGVDGAVLPLFQGRNEGTGQDRIKVPVGLTLPASSYGPQVVAIAGNPVQLLRFSAFELAEEVPRYRKEKVDLPAEEYIRPGWYGDCWHSAAIGAVYEKFFGTGAITDFQQVADAGGISMGLNRQDALDALAEAANGKDADDPRTIAPALLTLDTASSIQASVAFLVQIYSYVKLNGLDTDDFIKSYVWRPIASMVDMFGTSDLQLSPDGHFVVSGTEGFHSRAFGPYEDLFGLATPDLEGIIGIKRGTPASARADIRKRRQDAVKEMVGALMFSRAILG